MTPALEPAAESGSGHQHAGRVSRRVVGLAAAIWIVGSVLAIGGGVWGGAWHAPSMDWSTVQISPVLIAAFIATEIFVVHLHFGGDAHSFSLVELPLALGLFFAPPAALLGAQLLGAGLALAIHRRQTMLKLFFNLGQFFCSSVVVLLVFEHLGGAGDAFDQRHVLASVLALLVGALVTSTLVFLVISTITGDIQPKALVASMRVAATTAVLTTSLGVIGCLLLHAHPGLVMLVVAPVGGIYLATGAFTVQQRRHESLAALYEYTAGLTGSTDLDSTIAAVIAQTATVLRSRQACIVVPGDRGFHLSLDQHEATLPRPGDPIWCSVFDDRSAVCLPRGSTDGHGYLQDNGITDLMAVPLIHRDDVIGALIVIDRLGDVSTFDGDDLALFSTMAHQTTVTLENLRLIDRLRDESAERQHQAMHDELTGLPNRAHLNRVIDAHSPETGIAVALLDLDRFKEVNDTLGHHAGDVVLVETARRLRQALPSSSLVARLGGDEFAIVLTGLSRASDAVARLSALEVFITQPIDLGAMTVRVDASIGVAMAPDHGTDRVALLRSADVAMYAAKRARGTSIRMYDPSQEQSSKRSLELVGDLRRAVEDEAITVAFQPKARLADGVVTGAEALVRWRHHEFGDIAPDEFIPMAEQAGFLDALTNVVLRRSLTACRGWWDAGHPVTVAVNVDAHTLVGPGFAESVLGALRRASLSPEALTLEITEREIVRELDTAAAVIAGLRGHRVKVSIDDFGTGYSSLSYLTRLPVDEVKIDRSFVIEAAHSAPHQAIISAINHVAQAVGATTVVEGIEDEATWATVAALGCTFAQGYHLARPMGDDEMRRWLTNHPTVEASAGRQEWSQIGEAPWEAARS